MLANMAVGESFSITSCTDGQEITELFITSPEMLLQRLSSTQIFVFHGLNCLI